MSNNNSGDNSLALWHLSTGAIVLRKLLSPDQIANSRFGPMVVIDPSA